MEYGSPCSTSDGQALNEIMPHRVYGEKITASSAQMTIWIVEYSPRKVP